MVYIKCKNNTNLVYWEEEEYIKELHNVVYIDMQVINMSFS